MAEQISFTRSKKPKEAFFQKTQMTASFSIFFVSNMVLSGQIFVKRRVILGCYYSRAKMPF
jgi:hypothetical protein